MKRPSFKKHLSFLGLINKETPFFGKGLSPFVLPLFADKIKGTVLFLYDDFLLKDLDEVLFSFQDSSVFFKEDFLEPLLSPKGFSSYNSFHKSLFLSSLASFFKNKKSVFFPMALADRPLFSLPQDTDFFCVSKDTNYNDLIERLVSFGFNRVDFVDSPGSFCVRGLVIDFFPKDSFFAIRVSFDKDFASIYKLNPKNNLSFKRLEKYFVYNEVSSDGLCSVKDIIDFSFVYIKKDGISFFNSHPKKEVATNIEILDIEDCLKQKGSVSFFDGPSSVGFRFKNKIFIPSWLETKKNRPLLLDPYIDFSKIKRGDFLIHEDFGVGKFVGLKKDGHKEFLCLKYSDSSVLVSPSFFNKLSFFKKRETAVALDFVNKKRLWKNKVSRAERASEVFVDSLVSSYLKRKNIVSDQYFLDSYIESSFLEGFPFKDTKDQASCWKEIKEDLLSSAPMDRLLCGDVGFGKTELAMRAAFVSSINGFGVLVLAPTTVLSKQLYGSFLKRFSDFNISVGFVSRFVKKSERDSTFLRFRNKKINILVGTHSIMSSLKSLCAASLVIVDDEHKFGAKQKESIKQTNPKANLLYMSATPIPRTLKLALSNFKKMSILSSPPVFKKPTQTYVEFFSKKTIQQAILKEVSRGGQVFFVHNKVQNIRSLVSLIQEVCPFVSVDFLHGQEKGVAIEKKMDLFISKKLDVLVVSSIVENGIDIPNVNTIIINNSHLLGVSQLYQMRGRVGRSSRSSFAYLLVPKNKTLSSSSAKRLKTIEKNSDLGSCYSVAMEDLSSRGGGALFGYKQSGSKDFLSVELYSKVLEKSLSSCLKKEPKETSVLITNIPASIPSFFIPSDRARVWIYKELSMISSFKSLFAFEKKCLDMFGRGPLLFNNLISLKKISLICSVLGFKKVVFSKNLVSVFLDPSLKNNSLVFYYKFLKTLSGFSFLRGGVSFSFNVKDDSDFFIIFNEIYNRLRYEI